MKLRALFGRFRQMFGRPQEFRRPTIEVDSRLEELRDELHQQFKAAGIEPKGRKPKREPVDYDRLPV